MVAVSEPETIRESVTDPMVTEYVVQVSLMVAKVSSLALESLQVIYSLVYFADALDGSPFVMALFDSNSTGNNSQQTAPV